MASALLYDIFIAVSACLITAFVRRGRGRGQLIFININLMQYLEWLCYTSQFNLCAGIKIFYSLFICLFIAQSNPPVNDVKLRSFPIYF